MVSGPDRLRGTYEAVGLAAYIVLSLHAKLTSYWWTASFYDESWRAYWSRI